MSPKINSNVFNLNNLYQEIRISAKQHMITMEYGHIRTQIVNYNA